MQNGRETVVFFSINDVYNIYPVPEHGGGFGPLLTLLDAERARLDTCDSWLFGCGDLLSASPELCPSLRGKHIGEMLDAMGMAAAVFGNHEFETGAEPARRVMRACSFPWLGTNVSTPDGSPFGSSRWQVLVAKGGARVGLIGLCTPDTGRMMPVGTDVVFGAVVDTARHAVHELTALGVDAIVALTHLCAAEDRELAREMPEIDLILGGHDHQEMDCIERGVRILKCGQDARFLGRVAMEIGGGARARIVHCALLPNDGRGSWHPRIESIVKAYEATAPSADMRLPSDTRIAVLGHALDSRSVRYGESSFANLVTDALARSYSACALFMVHGGLFKARRAYAAGHTLTVSDIAREIPPHCLSAFGLLSGAQLRRAIRHSLAAFGDADENPSLLHLSAGWRYVYDLARPRDQRLVSFSVADMHSEKCTDDEHAWQEVRDEDEYLVGMSKYLAIGGDGFAMLCEAKPCFDSIIENQPLAATVCHQLILDHPSSRIFCLPLPSRCVALCAPARLESSLGTHAPVVSDIL